MGCLQLTYEPKFKIVHRTGEPMRSHEAKSVQLWLSVDPLAEKFPNFNPYNYVMQNPLNLTDPTGMAPEEGGATDPPKGGKAGATYNDPVNGKLTFNGTTWQRADGADVLSEVVLTGQAKSSFWSTASRTIADFTPGVGATWDIVDGINNGDGWQVAMGAGFLVVDIVTLGSGTFVKGAFKTTLKVGAKQLAKKGLKFTGDEAVEHFSKHANEIMKVTGDKAYDLKKYVTDANWIVENGHYVKELNAYVHFMGHGKKGNALIGVVGLKNGGKNISTFHIKSASKAGL